MKIRSFTVGRMAAQCYIVSDEESNTAFMIDPGDNADYLLERLSEQSAELKYVILTHGHFDHVMAADEILKNTRAKLVVCDNEVPALTDPELGGFNSFGIGKFVPLRADIVVSDGDKLDFAGHEIEFLNTPGHTKGSMCIKMGDVIFTGDTLFAGTCGRCDFAGGDYREMLDSLKRLAELSGEYTVYPGHGEATKMSIERQYNPYMREAVRR